MIPPYVAALNNRVERAVGGGVAPQGADVLLQARNLVAEFRYDRLNVVHRVLLFFLFFARTRA